MYVHYNPNPEGSITEDDCVIRALTKALNSNWDSIYLDLMFFGFELKGIPSANRIWGEYLMKNGFRRYSLPDTCPFCYTVKDFCRDHQHGTYVLGIGSHVVTVENGDYYDSWDSGNEVPIYFLVKYIRKVPSVER